MVQKKASVTKTKRVKKTSQTSVKRKVVTRRKGVAKSSARPSRATRGHALKKFAHNPIIQPRSEAGWEAWQTFNPGAIILDDAVHFLYRAVGSDGMSRLGHASSKDGLHINERTSFPAYEHQVRDRSFNVFSLRSGGSWGGAEDPRIVRVGEEDVLYMTYTAASGGLGVAIVSIKREDFLDKKWNWTPPVLISSPGEVHKNWVIFPEKIRGQYAILHSINPEVAIAYHDNLDFDGTTHIKSRYGGAARTNGWEKWMRGVGAVPIRTKHGWLVFYHAMDNDWSKYKVGAMLLDLEDPTKVLSRASEPVLVPSEHYENNGFKSGVVYVSGAVVKEGKLLVYYGGADSYVCVAHANFNDFVEALKREKNPKLEGEIIKKKQ